jgi:hypothetical protein
MLPFAITCKLIEVLEGVHGHAIPGTEKAKLVVDNFLYNLFPRAHECLILGALAAQIAEIREARWLFLRLFHREGKGRFHWILNPGKSGHIENRQEKEQKHQDYNRELQHACPRLWRQARKRKTAGLWC